MFYFVINGSKQEDMLLGGDGAAKYLAENEECVW